MQTRAHEFRVVAVDGKWAVEVYLTDTWFQVGLLRPSKAIAEEAVRDLQIGIGRGTY